MTQADLASDDAILDDALTRLFNQRRAALDAGNDDEARETHHAIAAILTEQARRLDAWIAEHTKEDSCRTPPSSESSPAGSSPTPANA